MDIMDYIGKFIKADFYDHAVSIDNDLGTLIICTVCGKLQKLINDGAGAEVIFWDLQTTDEDLRNQNKGSAYIVVSSIINIKALDE